MLLYKHPFFSIIIVQGDLELVGELMAERAAVAEDVIQQHVQDVIDLRVIHHQFVASNEGAHTMSPASWMHVSHTNLSTKI